MFEEEYLFLDDERIPEDCLQYMKQKIDAVIYSQAWQVVRSYDEFITRIEQNGLPKIISFDHDLGDTNKSGIDAAKWLVNYCIDNNLDLPVCLIHSMNPVGAENLRYLLDHFKRLRKEK